MEWSANAIEIPKVVWISGLVNPTSFLTAIKQVTAQKNKLELDKLMTFTVVTKRTVDDCDQAPQEGAYISGLSMDGARWDVNAGLIAASKPKEMFSPMPVINVKAVLLEKGESSGMYNCPVYKTTFRGPTYVFQAQLKTKSSPDRWVFGGVCLLMDTM